MFVQVIEFSTDRIDEGRAAIEEYRESTKGRRTAARGILGQDRDTPGRYLNIVFFPSYEEAMKNSEMPETQKLAQTLMGLGTGEPRFVNLDVIYDEED
jgi:hypothetical protein